MSAELSGKSISYSYSVSEDGAYYSEYSYSNTGSKQGPSQDLGKASTQAEEKVNDQEKGPANTKATPTDEASYDYYSTSYTSNRQPRNDKSSGEKETTEYEYSEVKPIQLDVNENAVETDEYYSSSYYSTTSSKKSKVSPTDNGVSGSYSYYSGSARNSKTPSTEKSDLEKKIYSSGTEEKGDLLSKDKATEYYSYDYSYSYTEKENRPKEHPSSGSQSYSYSSYGYTTSGKINKSDTFGSHSIGTKRKGSHDTSGSAYYSDDDSYYSSTGESSGVSRSYTYTPSSSSTQNKKLSTESQAHLTGSSYYSSYYTDSTKTDTEEKNESYSTSYGADEESYTRTTSSHSPLKTEPPQILLSNVKVEDEGKMDNSSPVSSISLTGSSELKTPREYLVLRAPDRVSPSFDPPPSCSYISQKMPDDFIGNFIQEVDDYLKGVKKCLSSYERKVPQNASKSSKMSSSSKIVNGGNELTLSSLLRSALKVLQLNHLERKKVTDSFLSITDRKMYQNSFRSLIEQLVKKKIGTMFTLHDPFKAGELSLEKTLDILTNLGIGLSPQIGLYRIKIGIRDSLPALIIEYFPQNNVLENPPIKYFPVVSLLQNKKANSLPFRFSVSEARLLLGSENYKFVTSDNESLRRIKSYCASFVYLCSVVAQCTFRDRNGTSCVEYPHLLQLLYNILGNTKTSQEQEEMLYSLYLSCSFRTIYHPVQSLREYVSLLTEKDGKGEIAAESALMATIDIEKKRRRNVVPTIIGSQIVESSKSIDDINLFEFTIEKVRVPSSLEPGCLPFCLVSVVSEDSACLPALKIPAKNIRVSSKNGYTWTFKKGRECNSIIAKVKDPNDRLYIECCFEKKDVISVNGHTRIDSTVWCAGYTTVTLATLRTMTLSVSAGSLLDPPSTDERPPDSTSETRLGGSKKNVSPASDVKVRIHSLAKDMKHQVMALPDRCLLLKRQLSITVSLRKALTHLGLGASCAAKVFAHQYARAAFFISSDTDLLDQLQAAWAKKRSQLSKDDKKLSQHYLLLQCCAGLAAAHNCGSTSAVMQFSLSKRIELSTFARSVPISCT